MKIRKQGHEVRQFDQSDIVLGRVLKDDSHSMVLEILKDKSEKIRVAPLPGDPDPKPTEFYTLIFTSGTPWEKKP